MSTTKASSTPVLRRFPLSSKPTLIITAQLQEEIALLHERVGQREWSGELITSERGKITDLDDWTITAHNVFLVDVGSPGFTGYEVDKGGFKAPDIVKMYEQFPGIEEGELKNHHIHTHHSMNAFFSGTDESQLNDRSQTANYFLMLIVNFSGNWIARVAFVGKTKQPYKTHLVEKTELGDKTIALSMNLDGYEELLIEDGDTFDSDDTKEGINEEEFLFVMDCNIVKEDYVGRPANPFFERLREVEKAVATAAPSYSYSQPGSGYSGYPARIVTPTVFGATGGTIVAPTRAATETKEEKKERQSDDLRGQSRKGALQMTEKEWRESQEEAEDLDNARFTGEAYFFDERHAKAFLNALSQSCTHMYGTKPMDLSDPISSLINYHRSLTGTLLQDFKDNLDDDINNWLDAVFPGVSDEEQLQFLEALYKHLSRNSFYDSVKILLPQVKTAIEYIQEEIMYTTHGRRDPRADTNARENFY